MRAQLLPPTTFLDEMFNVGDDVTDVGSDSLSLSRIDTIFHFMTQVQVWLFHLHVETDFPATHTS